MHAPDVGEVLLEPFTMSESADDKPVVQAGIEIDDGQLIRTIQSEEVYLTVRVTLKKDIDDAQAFFERPEKLSQDRDEPGPGHRRIRAKQEGTCVQPRRSRRG